MRHLRISLFAAFALAMCFVLGFVLGGRPKPRIVEVTESESHSIVLNPEAVANIARLAVADHDSWDDDVTLRTTRRSNGTWSVYVEQKPPTPDGWRIVFIDRYGNITDYIRGRQTAKDLDPRVD